MAMTAAQKQDAYKFFIVSFGAITGVEYMNQINDAYNAGLTTKEIVNIYSTKPQFEAIYPRFLSNEQFADKLIENVVGASATAAAKTQAKADVVAAINAGWSKGDVVFQIFTNLSNKAADDADWGKTAAMLNNKVKVAEYYTETLLVNSLDLGALGSPLQGVTNDAASVEAAKGNGSLNNGQTFTLTAAIDNIVGTAGNDTIIGGAASSAGDSTLGSADQIDGGAGTDTLKVTLDGADATPNMKNVEILSAQALKNQAINMINATGVQQIVNDRSTGNLTVSNTQELATVAANGLSGQNYTVNFKDTLVAGTADSVSVVLDNATVAALKVGGQAAGGFETVNLTAKAGKSDVTGAFDTNFTTNTGTKTINIDGAGSVRLRDIAATVTTIDASKNTGGVDVHIDVGTALAVTFTGGAGDDQIRMENTLTTQDVIDGGAGRDTIHVTNGAHLVAGLQVKNIEQLDIAAGTGTYNMDRLAGIDTLVVSNSLVGATTVDNLAKGAKIVLGGENTAADLIGAGDLTVNVKDAGAGSANDVIAINVNSKVGVATAAGSDLNIANVETVNITSSSDNANVTHNFAGAVNLTHALTINVTADTAALTLGNLQALALVDFNASASTKAVSITTGADVFTAAAGTAFKLGAGNDTLNLTGATGGNTANDADATKGYDFVINGGKGGDAITLVVSAAANKDLLVFAAGDSLAGRTGANNNFDTITNFGTTLDKIDLKAFSFSGSDVSALKAGAAASINTANGLVNANAATSFFGAGADHRAVVTIDDGANTWVYVDANKDGNFQADTDLAIQLVGRTGATVPVLADFIFA